MAIAKEEFYERFETMRRVLNLTQQQISDRTGISKSLISRYTNGKLCPNVTTIGIIAQTFRVNPAWLCGYNVPMFDTEDADKYLKKLNKRIADLTEEQREKILSIIDTLYPLEHKKKD